MTGYWRELARKLFDLVFRRVGVACLRKIPTGHRALPREQAPRRFVHYVGGDGVSLNTFSLKRLVSFAAEDFHLHNALDGG